MLRRTRHPQAGQTWNQERAPMTSALPRWPSVDVRCGMPLALRDAMDSDVVARWKRSNGQARKTGRVRPRPNHTARWGRHRPQIPAAIV
jgi:hypothetical protein